MSASLQISTSLKFWMDEMHNQLTSIRSFRLLSKCLSKCISLPKALLYIFSIEPPQPPCQHSCSEITQGARSQLWSIWKENQHHTKTNSKNPWPVQNISWPFKSESDLPDKSIKYCVIFPCLCSDISSHSDALLPRLPRGNFPAK